VEGRKREGGGERVYKSEGRRGQAEMLMRKIGASLLLLKTSSFAELLLETKEACALLNFTSFRTRSVLIGTAEYLGA
jgi:hypothetical protein